MTTPSATSENTAPRTSSLLRSSALMASGTLVSRILGFIRAALLVVAIGSAGGGVMAAFQTANTMPNMVFNILAAGILDAVLVPQIIRALRKKDGDIFVNRLLTAAGLILFILTIIVMVAAPLLVFMTAASFSDEIRALAIAFSLVCLPQIFFYGIYNLLGEVLNARGIFGPYMWAPVLNNIVGIGGLITFLYLWGSNPDILPIADFTSAQFWVLAGSATLGVISQALVLIIPLRRAGITLRLDFHFRAADFGSISRVAGWTFATLLVSQIGIFSSSNLVAAADAWANTYQPSVEAISAAAEVVVGNAAYATSFMIFMVPQSLIAVSLATAIFTRLSAAAAANDHREVATQFTLGVRSITTLTLLAAAILTAGAIPMMQMVLPRASTTVVEAYAWVLTAMLPGVASIGLILMTQRVYFAYEDAKPTFLMGIIPTILQVIVGWTFYFLCSPLWWVVGAAIAEAICRLSQGFIGLFMVRKTNTHINSAALTWSFIRTYLAAIATAHIGYGLMWLMGWHTSATSTLGKMGTSFLRLTLLAIVCTLVYFIFMRILSPVETSALGRVLLTRLPFLRRWENFFIPATPALAGTDTLEKSDLPQLSATTSEDTMSDSRFNDEQETNDSDSLTLSSPDDGHTPEESDSAEPTSVENADTENSDTENPDAQTADTDKPATPLSTRIALGAAGAKLWINTQSTRARDSLKQARTRLADARLRQQEAASLPAVTTTHAWEATGENHTHKGATVQRRSLKAAAHTHDEAPTTTAPRHSSTPVLIFFGAFTLISFVWALTTALAPINLELPTIDRFNAENAQSEQSGQSENTQNRVEAQPVATPKIVSANVLSWRDDGGDNENHAINMIDGNAETEWHSRQYDSGFGPDTALAIVVKLDKPAPLSEVTLTMNPTTSGGEISLLRYSDKPREGEVLATSAMNPQTTLKPANTIEVDAFVLRFGSVPQSVEGQNWAWIYEINVK